jgi:hypothetical protein
MQWPERFEERFHMIAHGKRFDLDAFLAKSILRPDFVWQRDAPVTSGVEFFLGDGRVMGQAEQERIAVEYMKVHRDELRTIAGPPGVDAFILGLVYIAKLGDGATGAALGWPRELMLKAAEIGITPIHYVTYDFPKQPDDEPYACFFLAGLSTQSNSRCDLASRPLKLRGLGIRLMTVESGEKIVFGHSARGWDPPPQWIFMS